MSEAIPWESSRSDQAQIHGTVEAGRVASSAEEGAAGESCASTMCPICANPCYAFTQGIASLIPGLESGRLSACKPPSWAWLCSWLMGAEKRSHLPLHLLYFSRPHNERAGFPQAFSLPDCIVARLCSWLMSVEKSAYPPHHLSTSLPPTTNALTSPAPHRAHAHRRSSSRCRGASPSWGRRRGCSWRRWWCRVSRRCRR